MPQIFSRSRSIRTLSGLVLEPGANDVTDVEWSRASASEYAQGLLKRGLLVVRATPPEPVVEVAPDRAPESLAGLTVKAALELISRTIDISRLVSWLDTDGRKSIRSAIIKRRYELEPPPVDEADAAERERTEPRVE